MSTIVSVPPAYDGLDTDSSPDAIADTRSPVNQNFLLDRPGELPIRGPLTDGLMPMDWVVTGQKWTGCWSFDDTLFIGVNETSNTRRVAPWISTYQNVDSTLLAEGDIDPVHVGFVDLNALTVSTLSALDAVTAVHIPSWGHARVGDSVYGFAYHSSTAVAKDAVSANADIWVRQMLKWDGSKVFAGLTSYGSTTSPRSGAAVASHYNRLFVAGGWGAGVTANTAGYTPNTLFFSDDGGPTSNSTALWQDNTTGLLNQIVVDVNDKDDCIVGLAHVNSNLAIFKRRSIHLLIGDSPESFAIRTFTREQGCIDPQSIVEYENGCFFASDQGFMWFDGSTLFNTTSNLRSSALSAMLRAVGSRGPGYGRVAAGRLNNGYVGLSIGLSDNKTTNAVNSTADFCGYYQTERRAWGSFDTASLNNRKYIFMGRTTNHTWIADDKNLQLANSAWSPESAEAGLRGVDATSPFFIWGGSDTFTGVGSALESSLNSVDMFLSDYSPIEAKWHSKLIKLSTPVYSSEIIAILSDYKFKISGGDDEDGTPAWSISLVQGDGTVLQEAYQVPAQGEDSDYIARRRHVQEVHSEATDVQIRVEWTGPTPFVLTEASILTTVLEYQEAEPRGSR